jgi:hypothetical protein
MSLLDNLSDLYLTSKLDVLAGKPIITSDHSDILWRSGKAGAFKPAWAQIDVILSYFTTYSELKCGSS